MPRSALFVVDIQRELAQDPKTRIPHAERIRAAGDKILVTARDIIDSHRNKAQESPSIIVFVQHEEKPEQGNLVRDTEPWKLVFEPREGVKEEILVSKTTRKYLGSGVYKVTKWPRLRRWWADNFNTGDTFESNPGLAEQLKSQDISEIIVFGIQSECCVVSTSRGALKAGFKVTLLQGAHSTYDEAPKSATDIEKEVEDEVKQKGADVIPWVDAVASWKQRQMISSYSIFSEVT